MKWIKNERGGALIIVIFILVLFTVLAYSLASHTMQSVKNRAFAEDEVQGKLLADAGLAFFQEYLESKLEMPYGSPEEISNDEIIEILDEIATDDLVEDGNSVQVNESPSEDMVRIGEKMFKVNNLMIEQLGLKGQFAFHYDVAKLIDRKTGENGEPSQPYVLKVKVSVLGMPKQVDLFHKVQLDAVVYINTIPAPFHYAVSTPGQLRLFGGSNIIGNVAATSLKISNDYRYSVREEEQNESDWNHVIGDTSNQSYIEGNIYLPKDGSITYVQNLTGAEPSNSEGFTETPINNAALLEENFTPRDFLESSDFFDDDSNSYTLSADPDTPYIPGFEAPTVSNRVRTHDALTLFSDPKMTISDYVWDEYIAASSPTETEKIVVASNESIQFEEHEDPELNAGFRLVEVDDSAGTLVLQSESEDELFINLTARLTGEHLNGKVNKLYIAGSNRDQKTAVEMGRLGSFKKEADKTGEPFTFEGPIYIKGNLDIVGDINVKGTIYVDGNVVIREIENIQKTADQNHNLVILASGTISLTDRYKDKEPADETIKPLSAFLYSESAMQIFSKDSNNRIYGGIATGQTDSYIELNTHRENKGDLPTHLVIAFNRKIFEDTTPGLPPGDRYHIDLFDKTYSRAED